ncbi:tape measure protein [Hydrocarboniphaga effusa]|uniref:tape measure protein n=1 Tax=Hydrocarboniphaga effusa TaxID=243629 RepID=UPI003BAA679F
MNDRVLRVVMTAEAKKLLDVASQAGTSLQRMGGQATTAGQQTTASLDRAEQSAQRFERRANSMGRAIAATFGGLSLVALGKNALDTADNYTGLTGRVQLFVDTQGEANEVIDQLYVRAQRARTPLIETGSLYVSLAGAAGELGASNADLMRFISGVNSALSINKTTAGAAAGGLLQLGQMMGGPVVQAQEFNSVLDAMRPLLQVVADNLDGANGSVSRLKVMVNEGKVTTRDFFTAFLAGADQLSAKAEGMQSTVSQAMTRINNAWTMYIGKQDQASGSTANLSGLLNAIADDFDTVASAAVDVGAIIVASIAGRAVGGLVAATGAQLKLAASIVTAKREAVLQTQATAAQTAAVLAEADAEVVATAATQGRTAALLRQAQAQALVSAGTMSASRVAEIELAAAAATQAHTVALARQTAAAAANTAAVGAQTAAVGAASIAVTGFRAVLAALGGPVGIAVTLLTGLAFWFMQSGDEAEKAGGKIGRSLDDAKRKAEQMNAARNGSFVSEEDVQDVQNLTTAITALGSGYAALMADINSGASARKGSLAADAAQADALLKEMQRLRGMQDTIMGRGQNTAAPTTAAPGASAAAQAEAEFSRIRAVNQAANAAAQALADQQVVILDEQLRRNLVGYREYYTQRAALETAAVQREIATRAAELAQVEKMRAATASEKPKTDDQRDEQAKKIAGYEADRIRVQGEINALKTREQTIGAQSQAQIAQAADDAEKRLADVRARLAELQGAAAAIGAETRAKLEREYAALLNDPSTTDQGRSQIRSLIDRESLQAEFDAVRGQADSLMQDLRQRWDTLSQSVQAGTIGTAQAQSEYARALSESNPQLQQFLQQLQQLSDQLGPNARREVQGLSNDVAGLSLNTRSPLQQLAADWSDTFSQMQQVGVSALRGVADELTNAMMTGKLDAKSLALSIIADLIRVQIQASLTAAALKLGQTIGLITSIGMAGAGAAVGGGGMGGSAIPSVGGTYTPTFSKGGAIRGPGTETSDSILARLSNHEYVFKAASAKSLGSGVLNFLNERGAEGLAAIIAAAAAPAYATGGSVGALPASVSGIVASQGTARTGNGASFSFPMEFYFGESSGMSERDAQELGKSLMQRMRAVAEETIQRAQGPRGSLARS